MSDTTFEREVERNFRWNFSVNLLDISFIMLGLSLISRETVIPLLVSKLTSSTVAIGLVPAVYTLGIYLPQLLGASVAEGMSRKKPFVSLVGGVGERLPYLLSGLAVLLLAETAPLAALVALVIGFGVSGASAGFAMPAWFDMIAKVIPLRRRGLFTGLGHGLGALMGVAGAAVIAWALERWPYPRNFALLFALAFGAMMISWIGLVLNREPANPSVRPSVPLASYLGRLPSVLRGDSNFARYIGAMMVVRAGTMAGSFFLVYGVERFQLGGAEVGLLTGMLIGCQALFNPLWGMLGDRRGHKLVLVGGALALALAALTVYLAPAWPWLVAAFTLLGAFLAADSASLLNIILEFCADEDRPTYIGLSNTLLAPVTALAPLLGGWLAAQLGFPPMFALAALAAGFGAALLIMLVHEPRRAQIVREQVRSAAI
ncbi:MAG TPA: MFS transporter [Roseiflexaceae bacterium]|nr:MFS transporter [Roseiflexaceae bacterium]